MADHAKVASIDAIAAFRHRLIEYVEEALSAVSEAEYDVQRTMSWLRHDRLGHWRAEIKRRKRTVDLARSELFRKKLESEDTRTSAIMERKALDKAERALEEAERKAEAVARWLRRLERDHALFRAGCAQVRSALDADLPKAIALLEQLSSSLEKYVKLAAPSGDGAADARPPSKESGDG